MEVVRFDFVVSLAGKGVLGVAGFVHRVDLVSCDSLRLEKRFSVDDLLMCWSDCVNCYD